VINHVTDINKKPRLFFIDYFWISSVQQLEIILIVWNTVYPIWEFLTQQEL